MVGGGDGERVGSVRKCNWIRNCSPLKIHDDLYVLYSRAYGRASYVSSSAPFDELPCINYTAYLKRFRQVICVPFFLLLFLCFHFFLFLSLFIHSYFFNIESESASTFQIFILCCYYFSLSILIFFICVYKARTYRKINFYYLSLKQNAIYEVTIYYEREYWFIVAGCKRARYLDNNDHRQSPRTSFGDDPRGHKDYHSMNDPSSLELFTKSHHAMTHLARNHTYAWHIWMHGRGERDVEEGGTYISLRHKRKKKAFNENYVRQSLFNKPFNKPNNWIAKLIKFNWIAKLVK